MVYRQASWLALFSLPSVQAKSSKDFSDYESGTLAPNKGVEISANLFLNSQAVFLKQKYHKITGQGHSHEVLVSNEAWSQIIQSGQAIVRSAPGGDAEHPHAHWVLVKIHS